ncbi:MAG: aminopeptidase N, partial [Actinomycetes bacterium]
KDAAWRAGVEERTVPLGSLSDLAAAFWQPSQARVLAPYVQRYVTVLPELGRRGMLSAMATTGMMFPVVGAREDDLDRAIDAASRDDVSPLVRRVVLERVDQARHMLAARTG